MPRRSFDARFLVGADLLVASGFTLVILALALFSPRSIGFWHASIVLPMASLLVLVVIAAARTFLSADPDRSARAFLRRAAVLTADWLPLLVAVFAYENIHDLTYVIRPDTVDGALRALDERLFGVTPALAFDAIARPWLSEVMSAAYALYFVYPTMLLVLLYRAGDLARFRELGLALGLCLYAGLLGYVLVPAVGPRYAMAAEFTRPLAGPWLTAASARAWNLIELVDRDCFPSLHTGITVLALVYLVRLRRTLPRGRLLLAVATPLIVLLWASTLYLRYHYAVDVLAGAVLAVSASAAAPALLRRYEDLARRISARRARRLPWGPGRPHTAPAAPRTSDADPAAQAASARATSSGS